MGVQLSNRSIGQKCIYGVTKAIIIFAVILIDIFVVTGGLTLSSYLTPSFLATVVAVVTIGYAICGNIVTYNVIKYSLLNFKHIIKNYIALNIDARSCNRKPGWAGVKNATRGRLALTGSIIYLIVVLFGILLYAVTEFELRGSNMYPVILIAISLATTFGIIPLINHTERLSKKIKQQ
jgi:hypothetical protein